MKHNIRRAVALITLAVALAFPVSTFAATSDSHPITESFTATQTVAMTVPATASYTYQGNSHITGSIAVTLISSTFATGGTTLNIARTNSSGTNAFDFAKTDASSVGWTGFTTTDVVSGCTGPSTGCGTGANRLTAQNGLKTLASAAGDVSVAAASVSLGVWGITTAGATYTGALNLVLTAAP